jgi:hypothetical protein
MSKKFKIGDLVIIDLFSQKENGLARMLLGKYDGATGVVTLHGDEDTNPKREDYPCVMFPDGSTCCFWKDDLIHLEKDE